MRRHWLVCAALGLGICITMGCAPGMPAGNGDGDGNGDGGAVAGVLFFLHHSVGQGIIDGGVRAWVDAYNAAHNTTIAFWDHGYSAEGLRNAEGADTGQSYGDPADDTNEQFTNSGSSKKESHAVVQ